MYDDLGMLFVAKSTGTRSSRMKRRRHADLHRCAGAAVSSSFAAFVGKSASLPGPSGPAAQPVGVQRCAKLLEDRPSSAKSQVRCTSDMT